jgi:hypothetical protein
MSKKQPTTPKTDETWEKLEQLTPDDLNANKGTARGRGMLEESLQRFGAGRSILVDKKGRVIAGNKTLETAVELGLKLKTVHTNGEELVAVVRDDVDLDSAEGRALAVADNRIAQVNLDWDPSVFRALAEDGVNLETFFNPVEMAEMLAQAELAASQLDDDVKGGDVPAPPPPSNVLIKQAFSLEQIEEALIAAWPKPQSGLEVAAGLITLARAMGQFNKLCSGRKNVGLYISALFTPKRLTAEAYKGKGFVAASKLENFQRVGAKFLARYYQGDINPQHYFKYSLSGWAGQQFCNEFRPWIARDIYQRYAPPGGRVLDPSHGWGGRMVGWMAADTGGHYVGFDPAEHQHTGVGALYDFLKLSSVKSTAEVHRLGFEEAELEPDSFDFAFTSPPYFDTEHYADEPTQAWVKFTSYEDFRANFYEPMIVKVVAALKPGASFLLNVGEARYPMVKDAQAIAASLGCATKDDVQWEFGVNDGGLGNEGDARPKERFLLITKPF